MKYATTDLLKDSCKFAEEYILQQCGSLHWWWLSKKWKRLVARRIANYIVEDAIESYILSQEQKDGPPTETQDAITRGKIK